MRLRLVSMLGFLAVFPAFGAVNLPVVNISGNGVSARSAFGDYVTNDVSVAPVRNVVARSTNAKNTSVKQIAKKSDSDILSPNLPSSNLWAENSVQVDTPLRMPRMDEIVVLDNDVELPGEKLETVAMAHDDSIENHEQVIRELESRMNRMAEIDAKMAKLAELQRRATNSVKQHNSQNDYAKSVDAEPVKISRTIVPMNEPDVLVRSVEKHTVNAKKTSEPKNSLAGLSPSELRQAFRKTFLSENKHLSAMRDTYADEYDDNEMISMESGGFTAESNLSEMGSGIRPFEIKISFRNFDSALSRENYTLLTTFAGIVVNDPKRAVQVLIPNDATTDADTRKLTARRLAIVEQVLRDTGVPEQRILPVLSNRDDDGGLVLRNIDNSQYEILTKQQRGKNGKTTNKTYKSLTW